MDRCGATVGVSFKTRPVVVVVDVSVTIADSILLVVENDDDESCEQCGVLPSLVRSIIFLCLMEALRAAP